MKKRTILLGIIIVIIIIGISIFLVQVDKGDELDAFNMDAHPGLEWIQVKSPYYNKFGYQYLPVEVEGTAETVGIITQLIEENEKFIISHPEELVAIKLDTDEEIYTFLEEMQEELKYTDKAIGQNMFYVMIMQANIREPEPQFLLYIPEGNLTHDYTVTGMEKSGNELYITIKKSPHTNKEDTLDGCLIGLRILKNNNDSVSIKDVKTIHIDLEN